MLRQAGGGVDAALGNAPAHALDAHGEDRAGQRIQHHLRLVAGRHIFEAVLLVGGRHPDRAGVDEGQRRLAGADHLADAELEIGHDAVGRGEDGGVQQVEAGPLERGQGFLELRIVVALRPELLARLGQVGFRAGDGGVRDAERRIGFVELGAGIDAAFDQGLGALRLRPHILAIGLRLHQLGLGGFHRLRRARRGSGRCVRAAPPPRTTAIS